ncbi:hypothetical protein L195_g023132 [Trifolium pratense]|uniref:Uncharacterized protein n=1 Tax=Trifolium pratense TaxID=57577 RepID=A0A2K3N9Y3_TRIPR|nr:hypothetical protein L195_g023132 [Trifolium pratense]
MFGVRRRPWTPRRSARVEPHVVDLNAKPWVQLMQAQQTQQNMQHQQMFQALQQLMQNQDATQQQLMQLMLQGQILPSGSSVE